MMSRTDRFHTFPLPVPNPPKVPPSDFLSPPRLLYYQDRPIALLGSSQTSGHAGPKANNTLLDFDYRYSPKKQSMYYAIAEMNSSPLGAMEPPSLSLETAYLDRLPSLTTNEDAIATTSPSEMSEDEGADATMEEQGFAMLKFPDARYIMKTLSIAIGRDMLQYHGYQMLSQQIETQLLLSDPAIFPSIDNEPKTIPLDEVEAKETTSEKDTVEATSKEESTEITLEDQEDQDPSAEANNASVVVDEVPKLAEVSGSLQPAAEITESTNESTDSLSRSYPAEPFLAVHQGKSSQYFPGAAFFAQHDLPDGGPISRKHLLIKYNVDLERFELQILGRNGAFVNGLRYHQGECVTLKHNDAILLSGVEFQFLLPDADEPDPSSVSGKLSYQFEGVNYADVSDDSREDYSHLRYQQYLSSDSEAQSDQSRSDDESDSNDDSSSSDDDVDQELRTDEENEVVAKPRKDATRIKIRLKSSLKKKSKHGRIVRPTSKIKESKKQAKLKHKLAVGGKKPLQPAFEESKTKPKPVTEADKEENQKAREESSESPQQRIARDESLRNGDGIQIVGLPEGYVIPPRKKGPGRPPKDGCMSKRERSQLLKQYKEQEKAKKMGLDPSTIVIPEPVKTVRPRKNSQTGESLERDGEAGSKGSADQKEKKPPKPPRSPSPQLKKEDYTPEQLQKPTGTYATWVFDAIKDSAQQKLNLQQIYHALEKKYPYFKFTVNGFGWQSSVRHNLAQYPAVFEKVEKDGKGWLWGIKDGATIDRERKKRSPPPPVYHPPPQTYPHAYPHHPQHPPHMPPNGAVQHPPPAGYGMPSSAAQPPRPPISHPQPPTHHTASRPPGYSSSYTTAGSRPPQQNHYQNGAMRPPAPQTLQYSHPARPNSQQSATTITYQRPSDDVIDVFKTVFKKSLPNKGGPIDQDTAEKIVNNAVSRVLDPESMRDVPLMDREQSVIDAFRGCLERSQAPRTNNNGPLAASSRPGMNVPVGVRTSTPLSNGHVPGRVHTPTANGTTSQYGTPARPPAQSVNGTASVSATPAPVAIKHGNAPNPASLNSPRPSSVPSAAHTPQPPAVEAITPPELAGRKRSISEVGGTEESEAKKAALATVVASVLEGTSSK